MQSYTNISVDVASNISLVINSHKDWKKFWTYEFLGIAVIQDFFTFLWIALNIKAVLQEIPVK